MTVQGTPAVAVLGRQSAQDRSIGQITQNVSTALTTSVLKVKGLAAVLAFEQSHGVVPGSELRDVAFLSLSLSFGTICKDRNSFLKDDFQTS